MEIPGKQKVGRTPVQIDLEEPGSLHCTKQDTEKLAYQPRSRGGRTRWDEDAVRDDRRAMFIREIETVAPEVLIFLKDEVLPLYRTIAHPSLERGYVMPSCWPESLWASALECGRRHNLVYSGRVPTWVINQFAFTLGFWTVNPGVTHDEKLKWWGRGGYSGLRKVEYLAVELPPLIEVSIYETEPEKRVHSAVEEILQQQLKTVGRRIAELPAVPRKRRAEHYTWAVLFQIRRQSLASIAGQFNVEPVSVRNEVTELRRQIGLNLPPGRPPKGTPRFPQNAPRKRVF